MPDPYPDEPPEGEFLETLLAGIASGNRQDFEALYRQTSSRLFGICLRVLAERAEAEDVLQDVFMIVWRKAAQFGPGRTSALTWLATIARRRAIDRLRRRPGRASMTPIEFAAEIEDPHGSPSEVLHAAEDRDRLQACLHELDARSRLLIHSAFFEGSTYEELAVRTGSPLGSVKSWIRRGLLKLRTCLEG